ncbi:MAG: hypothetical protein AB7O48_05015 [Cyclobacteriaceae bacterium]
MNPTIINIVLLLIICALPLGLIAWRRRRNDDLLFQSIQQHPLVSGTISEFDIHRNFFIGFSEEMNSILFKSQKDGSDLQVIDLDTVGSCKTNRFSRSSVDGKFSTMGKIELRFQLRQPGKAEAVFELYNVDRDSLSVTEELVIAERWSALVNAKLSNPGPRRHSA